MKNKLQQEVNSSTNLKMKTIIRHDHPLNAVFIDKGAGTMYHEKRVNKLKKREYPDGSSYISISNKSLRDVADVDEEVEVKSLRSQFDSDYMRRFYEHYQILADQKGVDLLPETLDTVLAMFNYATENDHVVSEEIYETVLLVDDTVPGRFIEYVHINNPNAEFLANLSSKTRNHLVRHFKMILEFHRLNINALINNREEAERFIHLLALSHYLMKIQIEDFKATAITLVKTFLHLNICTEDTLVHLVGYLCTVIKIIQRTLTEYIDCQEKLAEAAKIRNQLEAGNSITSIEATYQNSLDKILNFIFNGGGTVNLWARKNYREMKDWKLLRDEIRHNVCGRNPFRLESDTNVDRLSTDLIADSGLSRFRRKSMESESAIKIREKCFITWLKKGYRFKRDEMNNTYYKYSY